MREQVRILRAEASEDDLVPVGAAVSVGVAVPADLGPILDERAVAPGLDAEGHHEAVGEDAGWARPGGVGLIDDHHAVAAAAGEEGVRLRLVLVGVDRVLERGHRPQAHPRVPAETDEFAEAG